MRTAQQTCRTRSCKRLTLPYSTHPHLCTHAAYMHWYTHAPHSLRELQTADITQGDTHVDDVSCFGLLGPSSVQRTLLNRDRCTHTSHTHTHTHMTYTTHTHTTYTRNTHTHTHTHTERDVIGIGVCTSTSCRWSGPVWAPLKRRMQHN